MKRNILVYCLIIFKFSLAAQNVGINTTTPLSTLDIKGSIGIGLNYAGLIAAPTNGAIIEGNVGIGLSAPAYRLHVASSTNIVAALTGSATAGTWLKLISTSAGGTDWNFISTGSGNGEGAGSLLFRDNTTVRMMVKAGGNVGIGTTTPSVKLDVAGDVKVSKGLVIDAEEENNSDGINILRFGSSTSGEGIGSSRAITNNSEGLDFYTNSEPRLSITNWGGIGIGTFFPANELDIKGGLAIGANYVENFIAPLNGAIIEGNVGIGKANASTKLDVNGTTKTTNLQMTTGAIDGFVLKSDATGNASWVNPTSLPISITETDPKVAVTTNKSVPRWNGTALVNGAISDDGTYVGIGTTTPGGIFETKVSSGRYFIPNWGVAPMANTTILGSYNSFTNAGAQVRYSSTNANHTDIGHDGNGNFVIEQTDVAKFTMTPDGNVGIGTTTPSVKLEVSGKTKTTDFQLVTGATDGFVLKSDASGNAAWVNPTTLTITETDPKVASNTNNRIPKWNGTQLADGLLFDNGTAIGIGTTTPTQAKLVIDGNQDNALSAYGFLKSDGTTGTNTTGNAQNYSIYASNRIAASEFNAFSDVRIKKILRGSNSSEDLATLMQLKITDYKLIDSISKGNATIKKVIAQEVAEVYPNAVSKMTDFIPNIYQLAKIENGFIALKNHNLIVGDKVKIIFSDKQSVCKVLKINENGFYTEGVSDGAVFVYGKEINDFHTVDYEALSTLNISATQELVKQINDLKAENAALKTDMSSMKADLETLKAVVLKKAN
jgi:hypothetical protein